MARGTTLTNLLAMLKAEIGDANSSNTARDEELSRLLSNKQQYLAAMHDWPFLEHRWDIACSAGSRLVAVGTTTSSTDDSNLATTPINFERPVKSWVLYDGTWSPAEYSLGEEEFNLFSSADSEQSSPITKWRMAKQVSGVNTLEIWPMPSVAQTLRIVGQRAVGALATGTDLCDLDDLMLVLFVAGEKLARLEQPDASLKLSQAMDRLRMLKAQYPKKDVKCVLGSQDSDEEKVKFVRIAGLA